MDQLSQESSKISVITDSTLTADDVSIASLPGYPNDEPIQIPRDVETLRKLAWYEWFYKDMTAFLLLGVLVPLPMIIVTSAARTMFVGITGVSGVSYAVPAATASFVTPLFAHHIPYPVRMYLNLTASVLALLFCTLGSTVAGPVVGTALAGTVYAFGSNTYLATAAFYDQRTVITLSIGMNLSCLVGPALYIPLMKAFHEDWRMCLRVLMPLPALQAVVWHLLLPRSGRIAAELTRVLANEHERQLRRAHDAEKDAPGIMEERKGFGPGRTRLGVFVRVIFPRYVLPLMLCTCGGWTVVEGLVPAFLTLRSFALAPQSDLNYELNFLFYGLASFMFALLAIFRPLPRIWLWAALQWSIVLLGVIQLFVPFLTYFPIWLFFIWVVGGVVGGGTTNTNYKAADDYRRSGDAEEVRAFAMSCAGFGNFAGDVFGGALAVMVQMLAEKHLTPRH